MKQKLVFGMMIALVLSSASAFASVNAPEPYKKLRAVDLNPSEAPQLSGGMGGLSRYESQYQERLPLQLNGAIQKVQRKKLHSSAKPVRF